MSKQDVKAGRAFVELFLKNSLTKGLADASKQLTSFGTGAMGIGKNIMGVGAAVTGAGALMASAFIAPIKAAGDLMETTSKFGSVFGEQTGDATQWLNDFTKAVGRGKKEAMDGMAAFGAFFQGMGKGGQEALDMSQRMTRLAVDFGSFHNVSDPESIQRFISALSGSSQVLDMFGINIKQSALDMKLLEMGFPSVAKGADETQKVLARMAIIEESMGRQGAVGDAIRTAGSFSNQMKKLSGTIMDTAAAIGNALLPVVTPMITKASSLTQTFAEWVKGNTEVIRTVAKIALGVTAAGAAITAIGAAVFGAGAMFSSLGAILGGVATALAVVLSPLGLVATALVGGAIAWAKWSEGGKAAVGAVKSIFGNFVETFKKAWGGVADALAGGDLGLAAEIAFAALKVAAFGAFDEIRTAFKPLIDSLMGLWDIATTFFGVAVDSFKAAWKTFTGLFNSGTSDMGQGWADFAEGIVALFTTAARAVTDVWEKAVAGLAKLFLEQTWMTGVDVQQERARALLDKQEKVKGATTRKAEADAALKRFKETGDLQEGEISLLSPETRKAIAAGKKFPTKILADLEAAAADAANTLESVKGISTDVLGEALGNIDANIKGQADAFRSKLDGLDKRAQARGGEGDIFDQLLTPEQAARDKMDALLKKAADAEEAKAQRDAEAKQKGAAVAAAAENPVLAGKPGGASFGSFSAAALMAAGRVGGGIPQQQLAVAKEQLAVDKKILKADEDMVKNFAKGGLLQIAGT